MKKIFIKAFAITVCLAVAVTVTGCSKKNVSSEDDTSSNIPVSSLKQQTSDDATQASGSDTGASDSAETQPTQTTTSNQPTTSQNKVTSNATVPSTDLPSQSSYQNLCTGWLSGMNIADKHGMYDWDKENKYITCSKSLECSWGNGYGKSYLVDGVKGSNELLFDEGAWVACTVKPGWGDNSGQLDSSTVSYKKTGINDWLIFDLQSECTVDKAGFSSIYAQSGHGAPADFTIQVSSDKSNWTTVHSENDYEIDISKDIQLFSFNSVKARYVRFNFTKCSKKIDDNLVYSIALSEVEIWGRK